MFDEDGLKGVEAGKVFGERLKIVPKSEVAVRV